MKPVWSRFSHLGQRYSRFTRIPGIRILLLLTAFLPGTSPAEGILQSEKTDGYQGIWFTLGQMGEYGDKYSGGLGTYTAKHIPVAIYSPEAEKTFFVYGGAKDATRYLLIMASYYDHRTGKVPRPTVVHDKQGVNDPHDNASVCLDPDGYVWVFVSGRGRHRPGFKYRSHEPYSTDAFERISEEEMTYPQPWWVKGKGFLHLFTKYTHGRELYWNTSPDGRTWSPAGKLAGMGGHYQVSRVRGNRVFTAFNMHPGGNVDKRTNLYFAQTEDWGRTWTTVKGEILSLPLSEPECAALVHDYRADGRLVYVKDIDLDDDGNPVILIVTSSHHMPGPQGDPRTWTVVRWNGTDWGFHQVTQSTHNYDMGSLYLESRETWRIIGPTEPGPQPFGAGGEMAAWVSHDRGATWVMERQITRNSQYNQTYARRPVNAHPDFYALWADGNTDSFSPSRLSFCNREGTLVRRLPEHMTEDFALPETVAMEP